MTTGILAAWGSASARIASFGVADPVMRARRWWQAVITEPATPERQRRTGGSQTILSQSELVKERTEYPANGSFDRPHSRSDAASEKIWSSLTAD